MPDGEQTIKWYAENTVGLLYRATQLIKIDSTPPHNLEVSGWPANREVGARQQSLTVEATDGTSPSPSSGVKSITVSLDGGSESTVSGASCPHGFCTASGKYTLSAEALSEGVHRMTVTATDNASNVAAKEFTFYVRHASPVAIGPGAVDPTSGQFSMSATDVSLGGANGVSRTYQSRNLTAGAEGPLGPQWAISLGVGEHLTVLPEGSVDLVGTGGAITTFTRNKEGAFESPPGDSNLKLESKEREKGKGISEYVLSNAAAGTATTFTQPTSGTLSFANQFGAEGTALKAPVSAAVDSSGNVWVADDQNNRIVKFSATGTVLASYGTSGTEGGQFIAPWGISIDPRNGNVYVTDQANNRVEELSSSGAFIKTFGWGVKDGAAEFEICTSGCRAGSAGAGIGQFNSMAGASVDASGNVWIADFGNNRIQEFNEKGEYLRQFGTKGTEAGKFEGPTEIAFSGGNLYVTDFGNNRVQEFSTSGTPLNQFSGSEGAKLSHPYGIATDPLSGNLYVADNGNSRVEQFTPAGAYVTRLGTSGKEPGQFQSVEGLAINSSGSLYAVDDGANRIQEWMRSTWLPTIAEGPLSSGTTTYAYQTVESEGRAITEPSEALAPPPAGVSCAPKLERGCRALTFNYATSTTATGEKESEWGDFKGHLTRVYFHAWDPAKGAMSEVEVAHYLYDNKGRLRAEWDPRISPALKTTYGYDAENHLTSVGPPGLEPWLLSYGTIEGDLNTGRLLAVTRPSAATALGGGEAPASIEAPTLSTSEPQVGQPVTVSKGTWSNNPLAYSYQWYSERSETVGGSKIYRCKRIAGAVNATYTPLTEDRGTKIYAAVIATNAIGATQRKTSETSCPLAGSEVGGTGELSQEPTPNPPEVGSNAVSTVEYRVGVSGTGAPYELGSKEAGAWGQKDDPVEGAAIFPPDEPMGWPAKDYKRATIHYLDSLEREVNAAMPGGAVSTSEYGSTNNVVRTLSADNRAAALKEGSKSAEVAEKLDTKRTYSAEGTELLEALGPEHKVKLPNGSEVQARRIQKYHYDEGSPGGAHYGLVTKSTDAALTGGKEEDLRTTLSSYSGQENLGWKLRKPTSVTTDPTGLHLVNETIYDPNTGNVLETRSPAGNSETIYPPVFASAFSSEGSGNGQLSEPRGVATDSSGNFWVIDQNNNRVEKFSPSGTWLASYGSKGSGNLQFEKPWGIAINQSTGNLYVGDRANNRIEELSSSGAFVASFGTSGENALKEPTGIALDVAGDVFSSDTGHNRLVEFSSTGSFIRAFGTLGSGNGQLNAPLGIAISEGSIYAVDSGNSRVEQFSATGSYLGQFGSKGSGAGQFKEPVGIAANPSTGVLYVADVSNSRIGEFSPAGRLLSEWGTWGPKHENTSPNGVAVAANGTLYDTNLHSGQVLSWTPPEAGTPTLTYASQFGSTGSGNGQFFSPKYTAIDGEGNVWVSDCGNNRVEKFSSKGSFIAAYGKAGSGELQFNCPAGIDINQSTGDVYVSDSENHRIEELSPTGAYIRSFGTSGSCTLTKPGGLKIDSAGDEWIPDTTANRICEFSSSGTFIAAYGSEGSGEGQFKKPIAVAFSGENLYVTDQGNHRVQELSNKGAYIRSWGIEGKGSGEFYSPEGIAADAAGDLYVVDDGASHVEEFSPAGIYRATFATGGSGEGQLKGPVGVSIDAAGSMYVVDNENNRVEKWNNYQAVHDTKTIYYSVGANAEYPGCGSHPEWANLSCLTKPVAQPGTPGLPNLPETTSTYNVWDEVETTVQAFGTATRTTTQTYDSAGRAKSSEETATADTSLPKVANEYSEATGALVTQSTTTEGKVKTITNTLNKLGQLESYTDADGNTSKYHYDVDGRTEEVNDGKGFQIYTHDSTTGYLTKLLDSAAGTFTASYTVGGKLSSEGYPNGMTATYALNALDEATGLEYVKTTHCTEKCTLFGDTLAQSVHGDALSQSSTLASETYSVDPAGRITETRETPAGKGCTTRLYAYDEESNRTGLTTREPGAEGKCATEGGTVQGHLYDPANRLIDPGVSYDALGNATKMPAEDAGGHELTSSFYVDGQVATQTQSEETINYKYDPAGRTRETVSSGKSNSTALTHYSGPSEGRAWMAEGGESWTRNIPGIDGALCAVQSNGGTPVLQLHDLGGNVVATAALSETETKLLSTYSSTEFGVPQPGTTPPRYAWLGASGLSTELASGVATTGGSSYVPQVARSLQTFSVVPPGAFPNGQGESSPTTAAVSSAVLAATEAEGEKIWEEAAAARQKAAEEEAARIIQQCRDEGGCGVEGAEGVDPHIAIKLSPAAAKGLIYALITGNGLSGFITKVFKLEGLEAAVVAEAVKLLSGNVVEGLNLCLGAWRDIGKPGGSAFRCRLTFSWLQFGMLPLPENLSIETCFYDRKARESYDCGPVYTVGYPI